MNRGFTAIELAIVISISALVVPAIYLFDRSLEEQRAIGLWHLEVADQSRTAAEALHADRRALNLPSRTGLRFEGPGTCAPVEYAVTPGRTLVRRAPASCGGGTTLATHVTSFNRAPGGVTLKFAFELKPEQAVNTDFFIAVDD